MSNMVYKKKGSKLPLIVVLLVLAAAGYWFYRPVSVPAAPADGDGTVTASSVDHESAPAAKTKPNTQAAKKPKIKAKVAVATKPKVKPKPVPKVTPVVRPKISNMQSRLNSEKLRETASNAFEKFCTEGQENFAKYAFVRGLIQKALMATDDEIAAGRLIEQLKVVNKYLIYTSSATEGFTVYKVEPGDSLARIGKNTGHAHGLLKKINKLRTNNIRIGQALKVPEAQLHLLVNKVQFRLYVFLGKDLYMVYPIGLGKLDSTPEGDFHVTTRQIDPVWYFDGKAIQPGNPENELGTRWLGLDVEGYGIHGTTKPDTIGKAVSRGCVRLANSEIEDLFALVHRRASVRIIPGK